MLKITLTPLSKEYQAVYGSDEYIVAVATAHKKTQVLMWTILDRPLPINHPMGVGDLGCVIDKGGK